MLCWYDDHHGERCTEGVCPDLYWTKGVLRSCEAGGTLIWALFVYTLLSLAGANPMQLHI